MKTLRILNERETVIVTDTLNQLMLKELVDSEYSVTELSRKLNVPVLKLWRRMQKLLSAGMIELSSTIKVGNVEKKLYRATAARFASAQLFEFKPKDPRLLEAFEIYSDLNKEVMASYLKFGEIPKDVDPIDFGLYATMLAFTEVLGRPGAMGRISELSSKLDEYGRGLSV